MQRSRFASALATQVALVLLVALMVVVGTAMLGLYFLLRHTAEESASRQTQSVAVALAEMPIVRQALASANPTERLQPLATRIEQAANVRFVVFMKPDGTRLTHPNPAMVGEVYVGDIADAVAGGEVTQIYQGTLGLSLRTVVPVFDGGGRTVIGLVAVGVELDEIARAVSGQLPLVIVSALVAATLIGLAAVYVAHRVGRATHGMAAAELGDLFEYYQAVLHSVREGVLLLDLDGRVQIINDEARRLLGVESGAGTSVAALGLPVALSEGLLERAASSAEVFAVNGRMVSVERIPASFEGRERGTVIVLRDRTDVELLAGERDAARLHAEALHTQAHESSNKLHTVVSLMELGQLERAVEYAMAELNTARVLLRDNLSGIQVPEVVALLLGKAGRAAELGVAFDVDVESELPAGSVPPRDAVLVLGNLVDNALEAVVGEREPRVDVAIYREEDEVVMEVADNGPGVPPEVTARLFERGFTTKEASGHGLGLHLVANAVGRLGGGIGVSEPPGATFTVRLPVMRP